MHEGGRRQKVGAGAQPLASKRKLKAVNREVGPRRTGSITISLCALRCRQSEAGVQVGYAGRGGLRERELSAAGAPLLLHSDEVLGLLDKRLVVNVCHPLVGPSKRLRRPFAGLALDVRHRGHDGDAQQQPGGAGCWMTAGEYNKLKSKGNVIWASGPQPSLWLGKFGHEV